MELKIYNQAGELKLTVSTSASSTLNRELMVENAVSASFTHFLYVPLKVNDYVILRGVKYSINKEYKPKQKSGQEYTYSVKFYGPEHDAERVMYLNLTDGQYDSEFSLDGSPREHMQKWVDNMNRIYGTNVWSLGDIIVGDNKTIEYNNINCWDALASIVEIFETEWWADGFVMNLTRCQHGERIELGYLQGLTSLTQSENSSDVKFFTRLIPLGSTRNIDRSRYGYTRLQLPDKSAYVDRNTHYGLYEYVEEAAFTEIFPHYTGTVTSVRTEEKTGDDKKTFTVYYFEDSGMTFDPSSKDNEIGGLVKHVSFQTGDLAGRDFEANYNSTTKEWEIINTYPSEEVQIPGGNLIPEIGNKYIPWNFRMPAEYERQAELEYKAAVDDYLLKYSEDISKYGGDTDYTYIERNKIPLEIGQNVRLLSIEYFGETGYRDTRMTKVVQKLDNLLVATLECTNQIGKGWKKQVDSSISQLKYVVAQQQIEAVLDILKSWDSREITDYRLFSALRVLKEIKGNALSRLGDDEAAGLIKFLKGLISPGLIQADGGLVVRSEASNKELSNALSELNTEELTTLSSFISELGNEDSNAISTVLAEVPSGGFGSSTIGGMDNTDGSFDTVPDGNYMMQKRAGVYYPVKSSAGGGGSKMSLTFITPSNVTALYGKDTIISYSFSSTLSGEETGEGIAIYTLNGKHVASETVAQGEVRFNAGKYLILGDNTLIVQVTDSYGTVRKLTFTINTISISITSTFDDSKTYTGAISFPYTPLGAVEKTIHFIVDGKEVGTYSTSVSNRQQTYSIPAQTHGAHSLDVYITATIDGTEVESNHLLYDIISIVSGNNTPIIASSFKQTEVEQFATLLIPYIVYNPAATTSAITLSENGEVISAQTVDRTRQTWSYRTEASGELELKIACGSASKTFNLTVNESEINVHPELADLVLFLTSINRSNNEEGRKVWSYGEILAVLTAFNWATNGWIKTIEGFVALRVSGDARVTIPYLSFANDFRANGKTLEFEFETHDVTDYDAVVLSCMNGSIGLQVTAQKAVFKSQQTTVETQFKEDERVRVSFVVEKKVENRLIYVYVNGEMCGVVQYPDQDNFTQASPVGISIGNNECTADIFNVRVYDNNLNRYQLLDNYIADMDNLDLKRKLFARNNIYDNYGNVSYDKLLDYTPILTITGRLPQYKGDKVTCAMSYEDRQSPERSWICLIVQNDVQGTSSQYYPRKNYKFKFKGKIVYVLNNIEADKFPLREGSIPVNCFCTKADFAEASGTHNTGMAKFVDFILRGLGQLTPPQKTDARVRTTVDGFPIVIFHKESEDAEATFLGKYNFNNDKSTQETFGFTTGCECWELKNNTSDNVLFKTSDYTTKGGDGKPNWLNDFEARYPDDDNLNAEYEADKIPVNLKRLTDWLVSVQGNPTKFKAEAGQYLDIDFILSYYTITEFFAMVDQRAKNMFLTTFDGTHWIVIFYDNDTCLGINNEGVNAFDFTVEYHDKIGTQDVWNGEKSTLWNNVEQAFKSEIAAMYTRMRQEGILTYDNCIRFFETEQCDLWSEAVYNEDGYFKYVRPLLDEGNGSYLYAAQGSRKMHRIWWLYNRFKYMDSKYVAGDYKNDFATMRLYTPTEWSGVRPNANFTITSYAGQYVNVKYGSYIVGSRTKKNVPTIIQAPVIQFNDTETIVYGASNVSSLGDLSGMYAGTVDVSKMTKLTELIIGSSVAGYQNTNLTILSVGANALLRKLDIRNCPNLKQPIDLSQCTNIRDIFAQGTGTTAVVLPIGGSLAQLHLPGSITNLTVRNQLQLETSGFSLAGVENLSTIRWENTNKVNVLSIIDRCFTLDKTRLERVRIIGVDWTLSNLDLIAKLMNLKGLDENGNNIERAIVTGKCYVSMANEVQLNRIREAFPELIITYGQLKPATVTTFIYQSSQSKTITNASFTCNLEYEKVNEYTYKVIAEDGVKIETTFKCDNHQDCINTYLVAGTRTQTYTTTYIPLRKIRVKVYNQSVYVPGATVVINDKEFLSDTDGYVEYRSGEAVSGTVTAYGYAGNIFSFSAITSDTTNTVEVYAAVEVKFIVKFNSTLIEGANIKCGSQSGVTNVYGECVLALGKGTYDYTVTHADYLMKTNSVTVGTSASTVNVSLEPAKVDLKFVVKDKANTIIAGATVTCNGVTVATDSNGECILRVNSKQNHSYNVSKYGYFDCTGEVSVSTSAVTQNVVMTFNAEVFKPEENGNIQMLLCGTAAVLNITSTTSDYVIDWGDGTVENASGTGGKTYNHTYATTENYQVEIRNCSNVNYCRANNTCLIAYWSIGNSKVANLSFSNFSKLSFVGFIFKNDNNRKSFVNCFYSCRSLASIPVGLFDNCPAVTDFSNCFQYCSSLTSIPVGLFDNCPAVTIFYQCFQYCSSLTSIPAGLFDNCPAVTDFSNCFYSCSSLTSIPVGLFDNCPAVTIFSSCFNSCSILTSIPAGLFDNCPAVTDFSNCFYYCVSLTSIPELWVQYYGKTVKKTSCFTGCSKAANWLDVPKSWGGTAPEYVPPVQVSGVMMADYRALDARIRNLELQNNMDKN